MTSLLQSQQLLSDFPFALEHLKNQLRDNRYRCFLYILSHCSTMKRFFYSHARMAKELGCSVATLKRWLNHLRDLGLIRIRSNAYLRTNIYTVNECYLRNKHLFYSKYKNFLNVSLLVVSRLAIRGNELLLRNNVIIYPAKEILEVKREGRVLQLTQEQCKERSSYPKWAQDRALAIYNRKVAAGIKIIDHARFFMGILRSEVAAKRREAPQQQPKEKQQPVKSKPEQRQEMKARPMEPKESIEEKRAKLIQRVERGIINIEAQKNNPYAEETRKYIASDIQCCMEQLAELESNSELENQNLIHAVTKPIETIISHNSASIMSTNLQPIEDYQSFDDELVWEEV